MLKITKSVPKCFIIIYLYNIASNVLFWKNIIFPDFANHIFRRHVGEDVNIPQSPQNKI